VMGSSVPAVKSLTARAMQALRADMKGTHHDRPRARLLDPFERNADEAVAGAPSDAR
jgi:hypothetical protein